MAGFAVYRENLTRAGLTLTLPTHARLIAQ